MKKTALLIMLITILSKILGFARDIILSYFYGASNISDIYLISATIPIVIFSFVGVAISTGYIPMYSKIENEKGKEQGIKFTNNLVNTLLIICTALVALGLIFTTPLVKLFASGFEGETLNLAVKFTRISMVGIYFSTLIFIYNGFLQVKGNFTIPALIGFPLNIVTILSIIISVYSNNMILAIGSVAASASQLILIIPFVYKEGYKYKLTLNMKDKHIKSMTFLAIPIIMGTSVNQINVLVDRTLASQLSVGGITALNYADKLNNFIQGIFVVSIVTVLYPTISKMVAEDNMEGLKKSVTESISIISLLIIPATVGSMVFATPVVSLLFGRGAFDSRALEMTSAALFFYSIGMLGFGFREVLSRVFYSMQDTKTPMINATIGVGINIVLNIILSKYMGIGGLALATSISALITTVLLFISLRKKIGPFGMKDITISFIKILVASLIMGLLAKLSFNYFISILSQNLSLIISVGIGALVYFVIIYFMKIEDVDVMVNIFKNKLQGRKTNA